MEINDCEPGPEDVKVNYNCIHWSDEENAILLMAVKKFKDNDKLHGIKLWNAISQALDGRTAYGCCAHYYNITSKNDKKKYNKNTCCKAKKSGFIHKLLAIFKKH